MTLDAHPLVRLARPIDVSRDRLLSLHAAHPERYPALLESAAANERLGRFDILFACPQYSITLTSAGEVIAPDAVRSSSFLASLDAAWRQNFLPRSHRSLPFEGGWLLYLGYELAAQIEPTLSLPPNDGVVAQALRVPAAVVREVDSGEAWLVVEPGYEYLIDDVLDDIDRCLPADLTCAVTRIEEEAAATFIDSVSRCQQYISAGDIYQANLSRRWRAEISAAHPTPAVYSRLRQANPAPFAALAQIGLLGIASSSPERLVSVHDRVIETRPIAGTRRRDSDPRVDEELIRELKAHPKERAEHVMLIDLERNDLGRLCLAGSVEVNEYMSIESYAHVHHIVSNVRGTLRDDVTPGQVIAATFPGGTITGCPKIRCMQIIAELENAARGPYTGSIGYLNNDGSMDLNILIRTLEIRGSELSFRAGAGIVADSIAEREVAETQAKALGLLRALEAI